ncbi:MAG: hypothetical protein EPN17_00885 [Methylobacter sp.]|nr:MAG: hypothetical protein EPN17_00885 [Methylobacter sp.]
MKNVNKILLSLGLICTTSLLSGCMSMGTKVDPAQVGQFKKGVTTEADIVSVLGAPNQRSTQPDGSSSIAYMSMSGRPDAAMFIPYIGPFIGKVENQTTAVNFVFDQSGHLTATSTNATTMRGGLLGGD